ncbi:hypothetical protein CPB84DRAFT_1729039, partial [Gymnopilus junonius]
MPALALLETDRVPGEEELNELYESVLNGFGPIPSESPYSPFPSSGMESHRSSIAIEPMLERPASIAWSVSSQQSNLQIPQPPSQQATPGSSTPRGRRPLPRPPGAPGSIPAPAIPLTVPEIPPSSLPSSSLPEPSISVITEPLRSNLVRMSRKISRVYPRSTSHYSNPSVDSPSVNIAGPSGSEQPYEGEVVPTSPSTEFPDSFNSFLPSYVRNPDEDPNASASLEIAPPAPEDYTGPPLDTYEESMASDSTSNQARFLPLDTPTSGASIAERWDAAPDVPTFM